MLLNILHPFPALLLPVLLLPSQLEGAVRSPAPSFSLFPPSSPSTPSSVLNLYIYNDTDIYNSTENETSATLIAWKVELANSYRIINQIVAFKVMISMGCAVTLTDIRTNIRRPLDMAIGALSQFILMPLVVFGINHALSIMPQEAIAMMIIGTSPGGTMSNFFTFWTDGDLSLSICMTTVSTVLALGMMPLNLWIYTRSWATPGETVVPFASIAISLASLIGPIIVGMAIRWWNERLARYITNIGSVIGIVFVMFAVVTQFILVPTLLVASPRRYGACASVPICGTAFGYILAAVARRTPKVCRTIAFETGSQNIPIAMAVISLTYRPADVAGMSIVPVTYFIFLMVMALVLTLAYRTHRIVVGRRRGKFDLATPSAVTNAISATEVKVTLTKIVTLDVMVVGDDMRDIQQKKESVL